ncbi:probable DNA-directed RNA polymerases I, II, and III subunit RPABC3 [Saccharomycodes ludwigii]|uniref:DNA-directed RNA polymerases I, II, and III subunit RPABC3 n=1 Tax=Saccharomycodes ludwigii TaxID=36035 RepID=A0A376BAG4_9ASCO|nr:hypothetical protein SCDLUD_002086 [Saccharomycodes ludwigii]KAH3902269.1 hypothetical protein SCDLUD_002086 [Saccharomycodes ludwigii]SSD61591.1 probable DNA-directed RNA polymerases I, II, and III subunit RPABC3 [Saccharomycodes ludwigii]
MSILFDGIFQVEDVDPGRYRNISRIEATSSDCKLTLDINTELFPVKKNATLTIALASSLETENNSTNNFSSNTNSWRPPLPGTKSLADDYDYVMHGTAYKFDEINNSDNIAVYYSFGGLLLRLEGNYRNLNNLKQENTYILIRR